MSKLNGVTQNLPQQGNNNPQIRRPQNVQSTNWIQGTSLDDFKYGFPSSGLPSLSNRWWGSSCPDGTNSEEDDKYQSKGEDDGSVSVMDKEESESMEADLPDDCQGTSLLTAVRKERVEEGRRALKLGVFRGHGVSKLSKRERSLLLNIFRSSIPNEWINNSS